MYLRVVSKNIWTIYDVCNESGSPLLLSWIHTLNDQYKGHIKRLFAILDQVSREIHGPTQLSKDLSHEVDKNNSIYEFIAGDLRLLWFFSKKERKVIVCAGCYLKKGQKADKRMVARAIMTKKNYLESYASSNIHILNG